MSSLDQVYKKSETSGAFIRGYFEHLSRLLKSFDVEQIVSFIDELELARSQDATIFIVGNGGSAATASHMATDIGIDVLKKGKPAKPFRVMALTDNASVMTAIANDEGYENLFVNQLRIHHRPNDILIAISASGNSPNVLEAVKWVKERNSRVVTIIGFDGGKLKNMGDAVVHVETAKGEFGPVEDFHMIIDHVVANWLVYDKITKSCG